MVKIKNINTLSGIIEDLEIEGSDSQVIDCEGKLILLPTLIDLHNCFKITDWSKHAQSALAGGMTCLFNLPTKTFTLNDLQKKNHLIDEQLKKVNIPLRYHFYIEDDPDHFETIGRAKNEAYAIKTTFQSFNSAHLARLDSLFRIAAQENMIIVLDIKEAVENRTSEDLLTLALELAQKYNTALFFLHISTDEELALIRSAKNEGMLIYTETTPQYLFFSKKEKPTALLNAIQDGTIDTIGSGNVPIHNVLPFLLNAVNTGDLSLEQIVKLTRIHPEEIFNLPHNQDKVLVDLHLTKKETSTGIELTGWPIYTILRGTAYPTGVL